LLHQIKAKNIDIFATMPRDPVDIIWYNLGGDHGYYFFRRYCWNILGILLIIFISTPAVIFKTIKELSYQYVNMKVLDDMMRAFESIPYLNTYSDILPYLIILTINLLLLMLIDQA
jgi:hypothetical protein